MSKKEIFLIRHGETEYNRQGIIQGSGIDSDLNEQGLQQARAFYEHYKNHFFDKIYISELKRTWQTVQLFANECVPVEKHYSLNEISWGKYEGTQITKLPQPHYHDLIHRWKKGETNLSIGGGESPDDVAIRQQKVLDIIFSRTEEKRILICMHGRAMRIFLCLLLGKPVYEMDEFHHSNTSLYHLVYNYDDKSIYAERRNCLRHLE
ncbi:MAG: histidine phosphatase family protein [Bacteroidia bacterium]